MWGSPQKKEEQRPENSGMSGIVREHPHFLLFSCLTYKGRRERRREERGKSRGGGKDGERKEGGKGGR